MGKICDVACTINHGGKLHACLHEYDHASIIDKPDIWKYFMRSSNTKVNSILHYKVLPCTYSFWHNLTIITFEDFAINVQMFLLEQIILIQTFNRNEFWWIRQWHYLIASCKNLASIFPKSQWQVVWVKPWLQRRSTKSSKSTRLLWLLKPCVENMFVWVGATHFFLFVVLSLIWLDLFFEKILRSLF